MQYRHKLKEYRESKRLSQRDLSKILQISQQHYSLYERGKRSLPIEFYIILARYYNIKIDDLIEIIEEPARDEQNNEN